MAKKTKHRAKEVVSRQKFVGNNLSFEANEAYKLLRTNLVLSLAAKSGQCRMIGVTSSVAGECKSTTAMNLACSLAQQKKKVLYMEADLRKPVSQDAFMLSHGVGLTNLLTGGCDLEDAVVVGVIHPTLAVMTAGDTPPNPAELLGSARMDQVLEEIGTVFEYVIVDLPPVTAVSDALVMGEKLDGMVVVVRKDYCEKKFLAETIRRMEMLKVKVLGFVMTHAGGTSNSKYKKYGYGSYYAQG